MAFISLENKPSPCSLKYRVADTFKYCFPLTQSLTNKGVKSLTMPQVEFIIKAMGDWESNTFDVRDAVSQLVKEKRVIEENYTFTWNPEFDLIDHETEVCKKKVEEQSKSTWTTEKILSVSFGGFFAALAIVYLLIAGWAAWFTNSPRDWKPPEVIVLQASLWVLFSWVSFVGNWSNESQYSK